MKKLLISFSILLFTIQGFSQVLKPVKIDDLITVSIPQGFTKKDTLGQNIYSGTGQFGYILAIREANAKNNKPLEKEKDLKNVFKKYIKGIQTQSGTGSSTMNVRDTTVGNLEGKVFTLSSDNGSGLQYRDFLLIYTKDATYTFEYVYPEARVEMVKPEIKAFFSSLRLSPELQRNDQYTDTRQSTGLSVPVIIAIAVGGILLIVWLISLFAKRKPAHQVHG